MNEVNYLIDQIIRLEKIEKSMDLNHKILNNEISQIQTKIEKFHNKNANDVLIDEMISSMIDKSGYSLETREQRLITENHFVDVSDELSILHQTSFKLNSKSYK